jgi:hypothetical protein
MAENRVRTRRHFPFHLRTLFLFVTLACVIAGWIGWRLYIERVDDEVLPSSFRLPPRPVRPYDPHAHERFMREIRPEHFQEQTGISSAAKMRRC